MKMTIVTDGAGKVLGAVQGHSLSDTKDGMHATVSFAPGHKLHFVDVADNMGTISDVDQYVRRLQSYLTP
jgi:ethanolamine utilization microcompartment shell protein EutL